MQDPDSLMIASVGSTIVGFSRSSTRTSPGAYMMTPRIVVSFLFEGYGVWTGRGVAARAGAASAPRRRTRRREDAAASRTAAVVVTPSGRMLRAPATPAKGAAIPPNP